MYKLTESGVIRLADNAFIPAAPGNRDWLIYQRWLDGKDEDGNDLGTGPNTPDPQFTTEDIRGQKKAQIEQLREQKIAAGYQHSFPDGLTGSIQLRNAIDVRNVSGIGAAATALVVSGQTTPIDFTDGENVVHTLTPTEAMTMTLQAQAHISGLYVKARQKKDELSNSDDPANFDVESGW